MATTFELISSYTATGSPTSFSFTSIPQTFSSLKLIMSLRGSRSGLGYSNISVLPNGSTSAIYDYKNVYIYAGSITNFGYTNDTEFGHYVDGADSTTKIFGNIELTFPNYTSSNNKVVSTENTAENNSSSVGLPVFLGAGLWKSTSAITSITINGSGNNYTFANNSTAYLYGIKNS